MPILSKKTWYLAIIRDRIVGQIVVRYSTWVGTPIRRNLIYKHPASKHYYTLFESSVKLGPLNSTQSWEFFSLKIIAIQFMTHVLCCSNSLNYHRIEITLIQNKQFRRMFRLEPCLFLLLGNSFCWPSVPAVPDRWSADAWRGCRC